MTPPKTEVMGTIAPSLDELRTRRCSLDELQAALVNLIELHNSQGKIMAQAIAGKQDKEWRTTL